jgi:tripartite-type tricarboxylate transporter receptor subunit TctC
MRVPASLLCTLLTAPLPALCQQDYPAKPIRVVTGAAGGGSDFTARQLAQGLTGALRQPVVVDNRPSIVLAADAGSKSRPDGYTLFIVGSSAWIFPLLQKAPYDPAEFAPVSLIEKSSGLLVVNPAVPAASVSALIAYAKANPGKLNYGSVTIGGPQHLAAELFRTMSGVNIVNVPFKSSATATTTLLSGEVHMMFNDIGLLMPHVKARKLRALAVTSPERSSLVPELPTIGSTGLPGYEMTGFTAVFAPAKTPDAIVRRLNSEIVRYVGLPEVRERFVNAAIEVVGSSPEELAARMKLDVTRTTRLISEAGIRVE